MNANHVDDLQLLTVEEVAERLRLGRTKVYELMNSGELAYIKIGRACRIPRDSLYAFVARKRKEDHDA
jgi:excisionase family DNA binding protein